MEPLGGRSQVAGLVAQLDGLVPGLLAFLGAGGVDLCGQGGQVDVHRGELLAQAVGLSGASPNAPWARKTSA
ncbi:hypothetical protein [Streptomyces alanosinicus]|uniref:hypothetical protein n=1 Tax=Streptomyces alanosinicus TaxID=68171 RepID=UPI00167871C6|nr:hypothetical protein [Streptomyces alanosinicus]